MASPSRRTPTAAGPCLLSSRSSHSLHLEPEPEKGDSEELTGSTRVHHRHISTLTKLGTHEPEAGMPHFVPRWAADGEVVALALSPAFEDQPVPMGLCVGPAVRLARWCVALLWPTQPLLVWLAYASSSCTPDGFVNRPSWLWLVFLPVLLAGLALEWRCLQHAVVPFAQVVGSFRVLGLKVSYGFWLAVVMSMSVLNKVDMASDSFFLATALRTDTCEADERLLQVWTTTMGQSLTPFFQSVRISEITLVCFVATFLQFLYPLAQSTPRCGDSPDLGVGNLSKTEFRNVLGHNMNLGDALMILAEAANMASLQAQNPAYARAKEQYKWLKELNPQRSVIFLRNELARALVRIGLVAVSENAIQLNIQTSLFAMNRAVFGGKYWQTQTLCSIILSLATSVIKLWNFWLCYRFYSSVFRRTEEFLELQEDPEPPESYVYERHLARKYMALLCITVIIFVALSAYALCKLFAAFTCEHSVWNLNGCVVLPDGPFA